MSLKEVPPGFLHRPLVMICRFIPHPAQVVGEVRVEGHPVIPFGMGWMKRLVGEGDNVLSEHRHLHGGKEGMEIVRGGRKPLCRPFTACARRVDMVVSGRSDIWKGAGVA